MQMYEVSIDNIAVNKYFTIMFSCICLTSYQYKQLQGLTCGFGRCQAKQASIGVIIYVLEKNSWASYPLHVGLHCVVQRFTK